MFKNNTSRPSTTTKAPLPLFAAKENVNPVNFEKKERKGTTKFLGTMKVSLIISREDHNLPPPVQVSQPRLLRDSKF